MVRGCSTNVCLCSSTKMQACIATSTARFSSTGHLPMHAPQMESHHCPSSRDASGGPRRMGYTKNDGYNSYITLYHYCIVRPFLYLEAKTYTVARRVISHCEACSITVITCKITESKICSMLSTR